MRALMMKRIGVAAVFLVGCAVGGVSSRLAVPKASAEQAATLSKWEIFCTEDSWSDLKAALPKAGAEGWELVSHTREGTLGTACFKRPKL